MLLPPANGRDDMASVLDATVALTSRWENGWVALKTSRVGQCLASYSGQTRIFSPGDYANLTRPGSPILPGESLAVSVRVSWVDKATGFWVTQAAEGAPEPPLIRIYWSVNPEEVSRVLREVLGAFDDLKVKFSLKCPVRSAEYARVDTIVSYVEARKRALVVTKVKTVAKELAMHLREPVPPLTLKIAKGVSYAENISNTESFGQTRCTALVSGVLALLDRPVTEEQGVQILARSLEKHGIDPKKPWLCHKAK